jgi:uncharacterized peroxidase-related enzyme
MNALPALDPVTAPPAAAEALAAAKAAFGGSLPNLVRVMANSPAVLHGYLRFSDALDAGVLPQEVRERIALVVAEENGCAYCLSAHSYIAEHLLGLPLAEIAAARRGTSAGPRFSALLQLASAVNRGRGHVSDEVFDAARGADLSDSEIAEVIAHVAANAFTNYFAKASRVEVDFPVVTPDGTAA